MHTTLKCDDSMIAFNTIRVYALSGMNMSLTITTGTLSSVAPILTLVKLFLCYWIFRNTHFRSRLLMLYGTNPSNYLHPSTVVALISPHLKLQYCEHQSYLSHSVWSLLGFQMYGQFLYSFLMKCKLKVHPSYYSHSRLHYRIGHCCSHNHLVVHIWVLEGTKRHSIGSWLLISLCYAI